MAEKTCSRCGGCRPANSPWGLCPQCLLRLAVEVGSPASARSSVRNGHSMAARGAAESGRGQPGDQAASSSWPASGSGVSAVVDRSMTPAPRVLVSEDAASLAVAGDAIPRLATAQGRYQLMEEIARGGMGAILKGRDVDLGRDLAVKVILDEHRDHPEMVRRFVEEAQIGGQLEHPGIVPVHEIGRFADGRLYIAMKLVQGRTLAEFLKTRRNPGDDRARLLSVFEQVCQTMAYAHARGVVHRDLKPSNVMMGHFGEVQVMDWGLAKVLGAAGSVDEIRDPTRPVGKGLVRTVRAGTDAVESRADSVLGTPAYMAPEQARGASDTLDERADVFSLGSILCEILTGAPPYAGGTSAELHARAARADLGDAFERLDRCGADGELILLARACLAAAPKDRPRDAGMVLVDLAGYLAGVEQRLHAAGLAQAQAEARATEERKRRVLTVALAASVLAIALLAGGAWAWTTAERAARLLKTDQAVNLALDEATTKAAQAQAQALPGGDPARWIEAIEAVRRAEAILAQSQGSTEVASRLLTVKTLIIDERQKAEAVGKDRRTVERLVEIHDDLGVHGDSARAEAEWAAAFRDYGVDLDVLTPAIAGARLASSPVAAELAGGLDQWIFVRRGQRPAARAGVERLLTVAKLADPDPWRNRLRATLNERVTNRSRTRVALEQLAASADADSLPEASVTRLAFALAQLGNKDLAISLLRHTQRAYPNDFWVNCDLAKQLARSGQLDEAIRFLSVALAVRPRSEMALNDLGDALYKTERLDEAAATFRRALDVGRNNSWAHAYLGFIALDFGQPVEAQEHFEAAKQGFRPDGFMRIAIADALLRHGEWSRALDELRDATRREPDNPAVLDKLGMALLDAGRVDEAIESFRTALELGHVPFPPVRGNLCRALLARGDLAEAIKLADQNRDPAGPDSGRVPGPGSEPWRREARRLAALAERLPGVLAGKDHPGGPEERAGFAKLCAVRQLHAAAAALWGEASAAGGQPRASDRFSAACSAALAGVGRCQDSPAPDQGARDHFRQQALAWLRADMADYSRMIESGRARERSEARRRLGQWQISPALAGMRDLAALTDLPEPERRALAAFWSDVEAQRTKVKTRPRATANARPR